MKFAVIHCANGTFKLDSEWTDEKQAIVNFHTICTTLWNAEDVDNAAVTMVNEKFVTVKIEYIKYQTQA